PGRLGSCCRLLAKGDRCPREAICPRRESLSPRFQPPSELAGARRSSGERCGGGGGPGEGEKVLAPVLGGRGAGAGGGSVGRGGASGGRGGGECGNSLYRGGGECRRRARD